MQAVREKNPYSSLPRSERLPAILSASACSGLCGCYGIAAFGTFACGVTGNLLHMWHNLITGNWGDMLLMALIVLFFMAGIALAAVFPNQIGKQRWQTICLAAETALVLSAILLPHNLHFLLQLSPLFLAAALQYHSFNLCEGEPASTIFCSNNIRQITLGLVGWIGDGDHAALHRFKVYGLVVLAYSAGAVFCYALYTCMGRNVLLPAAAGYALLCPYIGLDSPSR